MRCATWRCWAATIRRLFGPVASAATANRTIVALADDELVVERLAAARKATRAQVWAAGGAPPVLTQAWAAAADSALDAPTEPLAIDIDATLVTAHSDDNDGAAATYKRGFGFHPVRREALLIRAEVRGHRRRPVAAGR